MFIKFARPFFAADGVPTGAPPTDPAPAKTDDPAKSDVDLKATPPADQSKQEKLFTQAELDAHLKDRLAREKEASKKEAERAALKAQEEAAVKNGEWQKLAETRQATLEESAKRIAELEPFQEQATRYKKTLDTYVASMTSTLPDPIKELLAGKDPVEQLEYLSKHGAALGVKNGVPPTPKPDEGSMTAEQKEAARRSYERNVRNNMKP